MAIKSTTKPMMLLWTVSLWSIMWLEMAMAAQYKVGEYGWTLGYNYDNWPAQYTFNAGDTLLFTYDTTHDVVQLSSESDYKTCTVGTGDTSYTDGNTVITLTESGKTYYFICSIGNHCANGMKVSITTSSTTKKPSNSSSSSPTAPKSPTHIHAPTPSNAPTPSVAPVSPPLAIVAPVSPPLAIVAPVSPPATTTTSNGPSPSANPPTASYSTSIHGSYPFTSFVMPILAFSMTLVYAINLK